MYVSAFVRALGWLMVLGLGSALPASGVELPTPLDAYGQPDPAAVAPRAVAPTDSRAVATLEQILQYDPENVNARVQNGYLMIARGLRKRALDEFGYALRLAGEDVEKRRFVHWNYGWAQFQVGDAHAAIAQWMQAERLHGGRPAWVPTTYAIGLWVAGERDLAVEFYRAAVRSNPRRWGEVKGMNEATRDWSPNEKLAIEAVHAAWRQTLGQR